MEEVRCTQCGNLITKDVRNCPHCDREIPEDQRKLLHQMAESRAHHRVYVYGWRKPRISREARVLLTIIISFLIILGVCRITHGAQPVRPSMLHRFVQQAGTQLQRGGSMMPTYEYRLLQLPEGGTIERFNEQIRRLVNDGWEPAMMSGDALVNILFRREASEEEAPEMVAAATEAVVS